MEGERILYKLQSLKYGVDSVNKRLDDFTDKTLEKDDKIGRQLDKMFDSLKAIEEKMIRLIEIEKAVQKLNDMVRLGTCSGDQNNNDDATEEMRLTKDNTEIGTVEPIYPHMIAAYETNQDLNTEIDTLQPIYPHMQASYETNQDLKTEIGDTLQPIYPHMLATYETKPTIPQTSTINNTVIQNRDSPTISSTLNKRLKLSSGFMASHVKDLTKAENQEFNTEIEKHERMDPHTLTTNATKLQTSTINNSINQNQNSGDTTFNNVPVKFDKVMQEISKEK